MGDAWVAIIGVVVGAILGGAFPVYVHNSRLAEDKRVELRDHLLAMLAAAEDTDAAVQRWVMSAQAVRQLRAAAVFMASQEGTDHPMFAEARAVAPGVSPICLRLQALSAEVVEWAPLLAESGANLASKARATLTSQGGRGVTTDAQRAYVGARDKFVAQIGTAMARARETPIGWRDRALGRSSPPGAH